MPNSFSLQLPAPQSIWPTYQTPNVGLQNWTHPLFLNITSSSSQQNSTKAVFSLETPNESPLWLYTNFWWLHKQISWWRVIIKKHKKILHKKIQLCHFKSPAAAKKTFDTFLLPEHLQSQFNNVKGKLFHQRKWIKYLLACATMFVCLLSIAAAVSDKVTITSSANWRCMLLRLVSAHNYNPGDWSQQLEQTFQRNKDSSLKRFLALPSGLAAV